jgi:hypothetical protein
MQAAPTSPVPNIYSINFMDHEVLIARLKGTSSPIQVKAEESNVIESIEAGADIRMIFSLHFLAGYCAIFSAKTVI